jgi:hypothetical protein
VGGLKGTRCMSFNVYNVHSKHSFSNRWVENEIQGKIRSDFYVRPMDYD